MTSLLDIVRQNVAQYRQQQMLDAQRRQQQQQMQQQLRGQIAGLEHPDLIQSGPQALQQVADMQRIGTAADESLQALRQAYGPEPSEAQRSVLDLVGQQQPKAQQRQAMALPTASQYAELAGSPDMLRGYLQARLGLAQMRRQVEMQQAARRKAAETEDPRKGLREEYEIARKISQDAQKFANLLGPMEAARQIRSLLYDDSGRLRGTISGPAVQAIIVKFVKNLDPTSVARESEVRGAEQSMGLYEYLTKTAQQMGRGRVSAQTMLPFLEAAERLGDISRRVWERRTAPLRRASEQLLSEDARQLVFGLTPGFGELPQSPPVSDRAAQYLQQVRP